MNLGIVKDSANAIADPSRIMMVRTQTGVFQFLSIKKGDREKMGEARETGFYELTEYFEHLTKDALDIPSEMAKDPKLRSAYLRSIDGMVVYVANYDEEISDDLENDVVFREHVSTAIKELVTREDYMGDDERVKVKWENALTGIDPDNLAAFERFMRFVEHNENLQKLVDMVRNQITSAQDHHRLQAALVRASNETDNDGEARTHLTTVLESHMRSWFNKGGYTTTELMSLQNMQEYIQTAYNSVFVSRDFKDKYKMSDYIDHVKKIREIITLLNEAKIEEIQLIERREGKSIKDIITGNPLYNMDRMEREWSSVYNMYERVTQRPTREVVIPNVFDLLKQAYKTAGDVKLCINDTDMLAHYLRDTREEDPGKDQVRETIVRILRDPVEKKADEYRHNDPNYKIGFVAGAIKTSLQAVIQSRTKTLSGYKPKEENQVSTIANSVCASTHLKNLSFWTSPILRSEIRFTADELEKIKDEIKPSFAARVEQASDECIIKAIKNILFFMFTYGKVHDDASVKYFFDQMRWDIQDFLFVEQAVTVVDLDRDQAVPMSPAADGAGANESEEEAEDEDGDEDEEGDQTEGGDQNMRTGDDDDGDEDEEEDRAEGGNEEGDQAEGGDEEGDQAEGGDEEGDQAEGGDQQKKRRRRGARLSRSKGGKKKKIQTENPGRQNPKPNNTKGQNPKPKNTKGQNTKPKANAAKKQRRG